MVGLCADMEGMGRDVEDCTRIVERHHGAQCASPLMSERRRGGADEVPDWCGGDLWVGEVENAGHGLQTEGVVVHVHGCEGGRVRLFICRPRGGGLDCVKDL